MASGCDPNPGVNAIAEAAVTSVDGVEMTRGEYNEAYRAEETSAQKVCKHYVRLGSCLYGDACRYKHPTKEELESMAITYERKRRPGGRLAVRNENRASELRYWLLTHFGREFLCRGSGVLDIAGGKGELAFELLNLNRIPVTVIDPRPLYIDRYERKWKRGYFHRPTPLNTRFNDIARDPTASQEDAAVCPPSIRLFFEPYVYDDNLDKEDRVALYSRAVRRAQASRWTRQGLIQDETLVNPLPYSDRQEPSRPDHVPQLDELLQLVRNCSILVGMHPDQAAEPLVDAAIALGKPFAVLPCCTYSKMFQNRRNPDGSVVTRYEELVDYLERKDARIRRETLNFEGKNVLLYADLAHD